MKNLKKALLMGCLATVVFSPAVMASSHREAPFITEIPKLDGTDFYMFRSYEQGRQDYVTLIANYFPLQDAYGGPNYFSMDPDALYEIHIDNDGDAREDLTFQFNFDTTLKGLTVPAGDKQTAVPLINIGGFGDKGRNDTAALNMQDSYKLSLIKGDRRFGKKEAVSSTKGETRFLKPADNIGTRSIPGYDAYANDHIYEVKVPNCSKPGRVFVGQRKEPFAINLGQVFDLVNTATLNPDGTVTPFVPVGEANKNAGPNVTADKNITSFALELPIACLTAGKSPAIGAWTTSSLPRARFLTTNLGNKMNTDKNKPSAFEGLDYVQVSRLGMPLVNELVIGLPDKDKFNGSEPRNDGQFGNYVTNPALPELLEILFGPAGAVAKLNVQAPNNFPRKDLAAAFLTGINLPGAFNNQLAKVTPSEMLRLDTSTAPVADPTKQSRLGVLGGDIAGFPNGRRPGDDVPDIELRVAMGKLVSLGLFGKAGDAPSGDLEFVDGALVEATDFNTKFPYLKAPLAGNLTE